MRAWTSVDYYAELGVGEEATRDEITAAFRGHARALHPDAHPPDPDAADRFTRIAIAYRVLSGPLREEYDQVRRRARAAGGAPLRPPPATARSGARFQLTRRGARLALWSGIALVLVGLAASGGIVALQVRDADLRARGVAATATVVLAGGERRLAFTTKAGRPVRTELPNLKSGESPAVGSTVQIRYDRDHPQRIITEADTTARDITLWIVAAKLLVVGLVLVVVGARRLARPERA